VPRYAAFLRGITPMNAKMAELKAAFESAGFTDVVTVLSSGNVIFTARATSAAALERQATAAMTRRLGHAFVTFVRPIKALEDLLAADPYRVFRLNPGSKRVVTFLLEKPAAKLKLPIELDGARILAQRDREIFSAYVPSPKGPVFMTLLQKTFGKDQTTRTWETIAKVAGAKKR